MTALFSFSIVLKKKKKSLLLFILRYKQYSTLDSC